MGYNPVLLHRVRRSASAVPRGGIGRMAPGTLSRQINLPCDQKERSQKRRPIGASRRSRGSQRLLFARFENQV